MATKKGAKTKEPVKKKAEANQPSGFLGAVERVGNKVPHPVLMFGYLIIFVIILSWVLSLLGVHITEHIAVPVGHDPTTDVVHDYYEDLTVPIQDPTAPPTGWEIVTKVVPINSMISIEGIRFIFTSFVSNFAGFSVVAVTFIAMMGAGVAEQSGLLGSLIHKMVGAAPPWALTFLMVFVGVLSSVASDAGYLILIPLAAAAFASVGRHPLAGLGAGFAGVAAIFMVNVIPTPTDAMITEIANEAMGSTGTHLTIVANYFFMVASSFILAFVASVVTDKIIEPRLGKWVPEKGVTVIDEVMTDPEADKRGSRYALWALLAVVAIVAAFTIPPGSPLRDPETGDIIGQTPFMDSLLFIIMLIFLISGIAYGIGAGTIKGSGDVIAAITKTFAGLGGMVLMLLMISQFIAVFNWTNLPTVLAGWLAEMLEQANIGAVPLLLGFIVVILLLDFLMPGALPKWAIFAPIFVPLFIRLGVEPQTTLAAYRVADSPVNALTPLMVYLPFIVTIAQRYDKKSGIGTVIALMLPYSAAIFLIWVIMFVAWFLLGIPLGPGYLPAA